MEKLEHAHHLVHFYKSSQALAEAVCSYVVPGITRGDGIILIAQQKNLKNFQNLLENRAIDVTMARAFGQILLIDAHETLSQFMKDGLPQAQPFYDTISPILEKMQQRFPVIRAYGEMVDILLDQKNFAAVIKLEQLWNELSKKYNFSLLCGYANQVDESVIREICRNHTHNLSHDGLTSSL
jgi:hypothetical protein